METSKPAQVDCDALLTCEMTLSHPFNPEIDSLPKPRHMHNKKMRAIRRKLNILSESSGTRAKEWKRRLAGAPIDAVAKTLGCTTRLAMHVEITVMCNYI